MSEVPSFGCRLNIAESAVLAGLSDDPGLTVVNSCAVTAEAVRQGAQAARRASRAGRRVVVTGCDHACTFCIIVRARGPSISTPVVEVIDGIARLVPGTPAARMPRVEAATARERAARQRSLGEARPASALSAAIGQPQRVLVERSGTRDRTETYLPARVPPAPAVSIVTVTGRAVVGGILECA